MRAEDKSLLLGIGVGLMVAVGTLTLMVGGNRPLNDMEVVKRARDLGMTFRDEGRSADQALNNTITAK